MAWSRASRHERGYGNEWGRRRLAVLERDCYLCRCAECISLDRIRPANEVDHRIPKAKGGTDDLENLCAINHECHRRKTAIENGRTPERRPQIGKDGFPAR